MYKSNVRYTIAIDNYSFFVEKQTLFAGAGRSRIMRNKQCHVTMETQRFEKFQTCSDTDVEWYNQKTKYKGNLKSTISKPV